MKMEYKTDYYLAEIIEVPIGANIIYYIEVNLKNGENIIENNEGRYFIYRVGTSEIEEPRESLSEGRREPSEKVPSRPKEYYKPDMDSLKEISIDNTEEIQEEEDFAPEYIENPKEFFKDSEDLTIFGLPQTEKDPDLKICPNCESKIKKMWNICPICGYRIQ